MMNKLNIELRNLDMKNNILRDMGTVPGVVYGPEMDTTPIKLTAKELSKALSKPGEIYQIKSKSGSVIVKFDEVQRDPVTRHVKHFSLLQMPKGEKNEVEIPIDLKGRPKGTKKGGVLVVLKDSITVAGKPKSMPNMIEANVASLDIGDKLTVDDLKIPGKVEATIDEDEVVAICKPRAKEIETGITEESGLSIEELSEGEVSSEGGATRAV